MTDEVSIRVNEDESTVSNKQQSDKRYRDAAKAQITVSGCTMVNADRQSGQN